MAAHFEPVVNANCRLVASPPTRRTAIGGYPKVASYDMLGKQLYYSNPLRRRRRFLKRLTTCIHGVITRIDIRVERKGGQEEESGQPASPLPPYCHQCSELEGIGALIVPSRKFGIKYGTVFQFLSDPNVNLMSEV